MEEILAQLQAQLERQLQESHDSSEHAFKPAENDPSICAECGWMGLDGPILVCGHTRRDHAVEFLTELQAGEISLGEPIMVIRVSIVPRPRSLWDLLSGS